ncbi:MAG: ATP-binding protein [Candidatus Aenigmarchaeota archaeon]|nr:ATP-binding protein [Candidatus Aenigmarchaeota archaeon]
MDKTEFIKEIARSNPWWQTGKVDLDKNLIERDIYKEIKETLKKQEICAITGLRQVGKTTIMMQSIDNLIKKGVNPKRIFYFSFDDPYVYKEERIINYLIDIYLETQLEESLTELKNTVYIFFDETQHIENWSSQIKNFYDKTKKLKFVISGSSSMYLLKGAGESLVGRISIKKLHPFSFHEFLKYNKINIDSPELNISDLNKSSKKLNNVLINSEKLKIYFNKYFKFGGFAGTYEDEKHLKEKLKTITYLTFYRDIVNLFEVKRIDVLESLFVYFVKNTSNIINFDNLTKLYGIKHETLKTYISYLNTSYLIKKSYAFSDSKQIKKNPKIYIADISFEALHPIDVGFKAETLVYNHLNRYFNLSYWRNKKDQEIDVIVNNEKIVPVEVKYKSRIQNKELENIRTFMKEYNCDFGIIVTRDIFEFKNNLYFIPVWLFLLIKF